jgi:uncharacterized protein YjiS (DUF1127 family)
MRPARAASLREQGDAAEGTIMSEIWRSGGIVPARRRVPSNLCKLFDLLVLWRQRSRERRKLDALSDHVLKDIGLTRADTDSEVRKSFWRR